MIDLSRFDKYVEQGLISRKVSPCGRLVLFDYTEKCQWEKAWDDITLNARGTVYELATGEVIARAFPKFFNFSELSAERQQELLSQSFTVHEKMDGSLGIVYFYDGEWRVNTRGSFISDQAVKGKELLAKFEDGLCFGFTYLVEIIYPENRIVVDYKGEEKLTFLSAYNIALGTEHPAMAGCFDHKAKECSFKDVLELNNKLKELSFNEEGYVVKFADGTRAKFKGDEYVKMHRIISGISPLVLWESMKGGKVSEELLASIPEEFREQYEVMAKKLEQNYYSFFFDLTFFFGQLAGKLDGSGPMASPEMRKELGLYLKNNPHELNQYMFPVALGQTEVLDKLINKAIRPKANVL